uniref:Uncharacterized protein n=1 Tax=Rhizophora mucronata TaxID=61149 RepID=A0A2P2ND21_RHIMU
MCMEREQVQLKTDNKSKSSCQCIKVQRGHKTSVGQRELVLFVNQSKDLSISFQTYGR